MITTQTKTTGHFKLNASQPLNIKNASDINLDTIKTASEGNFPATEKHIRHEKGTNLPINFFHRPGDYNRMLIRCQAPEVGNIVERKMGIIKNLEFVNEPLFQKEKEKRYERVRQYCNSVKKTKVAMSQNASVFKECSCCCCDTFCKQCAKTSLCEFTCENKACKGQKMLIDIEGMKRGEGLKKKKRNFKSIQVSSEVFDPHLCCSTSNKSKNSRFHINQLVNKSIMKQIQIKREKQLSQLSVKEIQKFKESYNRMVRETNRTNSVSKSSRMVKSVPKSKKEIRDAYWNQVKDLVGMELQKEKFQKSTDLLKDQDKAEQHVCLKKSKRNLSKKEMEKLRSKYGKEAIKEEQVHKFKKEMEEKIKSKKLIALAAQQEEILKKNPKKHFKPSKEMMESAFQGLNEA